ncbi:MAG TPA: malto-oligosyltrehalose trehalohydrolase [Cyanobacteria bacterium UBA11149]|nr:malto-oligosyltrehalose trehalohydrolase [Cyanobacteria bacterium UBA11367]HBE57668.1 malto-oligosyltrehalose trehalohydrolase [Cyanobacteria bacterium UBA11366]HBK65858.1 malto-oligosyltrehalose trehalohydrolase [Cyanobacteria bacterium UBA11166]HBR72870.1 malto-oligosyltrehalose trehalohydrolase [Cyanobacteria bacterium UBA11159]HBS67834.1 malto-oligosyltrehalose trehalohydrolase [Cyanobacteria bacterium UBA11153]HBW90225.1 malto-oligosyltrehalose trehalohydrolase [Cyanobacteria bacterium
MKIGATYLGDGLCEFTVWAPLLSEVTLEIITPETRSLPMAQDKWGYWQVTASDIAPGTLYQYQLPGDIIRPDPASHSQPQGVHKSSQVVDQNAFTWKDRNWQGIPLADLIIYELHVGTFTPEGTFEAIISRLPQLQEIGINAIELMPVAQFPGDRNWGYDGVYPFAVQDSYGGVAGLKGLVDACHQQGIAVILDVVYNHLGPEGNYTANFAPYFTNKYQTPWGSALNFDDAYSDGVRNFFIENALYWLRDYHIDALRLDAIHAIYDYGGKHFLAELAEKVAEFSQERGRKFYLIAESDLNDVRIINPPEMGGYNIDGQWSDDFHHSLHTLLTGENQGYYQDYGSIKQLAKVLREGFAYTWNYSPFRKRHHGNYPGNCPPHQFVVCAQNHDQIGNRMLGERLSHLVSFEALKLSAGTVLLSPYIPLLFMGEEYGEEAPFLYFISHGDPNLVEAVRQGRKNEFAAFHLEGEPPDAQSPDTFEQCKLNWHKRTQGKHHILLKFYQDLIRLRRQIPALKSRDRQSIEVTSAETHKFLTLRRWSQDSQIFCLMNFSTRIETVSTLVPPGNWQKQLDSSDSQWLGNGYSLPQTIAGQQNLTIQSQSFALYTLSA